MADCFLHFLRIVTKQAAVNLISQLLYYWYVQEHVCPNECYSKVKVYYRALYMHFPYIQFQDYITVHFIVRIQAGIFESPAILHKPGSLQILMMI